MDRIDRINELIEKGYQKERKQSLVLGNFYALITIVVVSIAIVMYVNYLRPNQIAQMEKEAEALKQKELALQKREKELALREKQIALAHKLNSKEYEDKNLTKNEP